MTSASNLAQEIVTVLQEALPEKEEGKKIALHEPVFEGNEWVYVKECIDTRWVSSAGKYVDQFEEMLADYTGAKRAVAAVNGTAALQVALQLAGVEQGDEVLVPALTFVATTNAVSYGGGIPHFIDSEEETLGVDPQKLDGYLQDLAEERDGVCYNHKTGRCIRAVVPMHTFGHPVDLQGLQRVCERYGIVMVEDAAESLGSLYEGRHTGTFGRVAALSFNGNKTITTGGGGALLTNDENLADRAKHLTTTAKVDHQWEYFHDQAGYNFRLPNLNAALGCAQLEQLNEFLACKRKLAQHYKQVFDSVKGVHFVDEPSNAHSNFWLNAILLDEERAEERDDILRRTNEAGYMTRPAWTLMPKLPMYNDCPRMDCSVAESLEKRLINIPSTPTLAR